MKEGKDEVEESTQRLMWTWSKKQAKHRFGKLEAKGEASSTQVT